MINNASAATNHGAAVYAGRFWTRAALRRPLLSDGMVVYLVMCLPAVVLRATDLVALR